MRTERLPAQTVMALTGWAVMTIGMVLGLSKSTNAESSSALR